MIVLGLDLASKTGWALSAGLPFNEMMSGVWHLNRKGDDGLRSRLVNLRTRLDSLPEKPTLVVHETAHHRGGPATRSALGLAGVLLQWCGEHNIPDHGVYPSTLKLWSTGHGKARKEAMIVAAEAFVDHGVETDDEADAILLACYGVGEVLGVDW